MKKILSLALSFAMLVCLLAGTSTTTFAEEVNKDTIKVELVVSGDTTKADPTKDIKDVDKNISKTKSNEEVSASIINALPIYITFSDPSYIRVYTQNIGVDTVDRVYGTFELKRWMSGSGYAEWVTVAKLNIDESNLKPLLYRDLKTAYYTKLGSEKVVVTLFISDGGETTATYGEAIRP
ncbi:MAG: hypothetical protein VB130_00800 [Clostridium sp.]|nr:hypothetical protein [Clostridium sp.]